MANWGKELSWRISAIIERWRYFGFNKEKIASLIGVVDKHNASGLIIACPVTAAIIVLLSFYPDCTGKSKTVYFAFAIFQFFLFFYNITLVKKSIKTHAAYMASVIIYTAVIFLFAMYVCIFTKGIYTLRFLLFFLSFEVMFVYGAFFSLALNAGIMVGFIFFYKYSQKLFGIELAMNSYYDILNVAACSVLTLIMNWYSSFVFFKSVVNSSSLEAERDLFHEESIHDQLTGLNNRRSFEQSVPLYISVCRHVHQTVCAIMMDIDFFKNYNDNYGHQKGDEVLQTVGNLLKRLMEEEKLFAARVGGEEFIVIWTENRIIEAERVALKIRQLLIETKIPHEFSATAPYVTASLGLYIMRGGCMDSAEELYKNADTALYKAKEAGRNCVICLDSQDGSFRTVELRDYTGISR
ncbi:MAG: hypothetical protein Pg6A_03140 [Termitinemataceae bacterium]|jgi:diguanylate cyclase (GGDEF)-like protein|nr:MAG: hypothetical protein Pg6A_03140 [Termitinemataceae bacterium]